MDAPGGGDSDPAPLLAQVRELYGRAAYTHKTHEKQADICSQRYTTQRRLQVALTAVSSGTFLASLLGVILDEQSASLITSFIALVVTAANLGTKSFKHGEEMEQHRDTAARLWSIRESYLSLITDLRSEVLALGEARAERDRLQESYCAIIADAPRTTAKAYAAAQSAIKDREDLTFSTEEIDLMLPSKLREKGTSSEDQ